MKSSFADNDIRESVVVETITKDTATKEKLELPARQVVPKRETFATFGDFPSEEADTALY